MPGGLPASSCILLLTLLLGVGVGVAAEDREQAAARLEAVRARIGELEQSIEAAKGKAEVLQRQLRELEQEITQSDSKLGRLQERIADKTARLEKLDREREQREATLTDARAALARQLRAAYKNGRRDYLKLLLNQQDPATMGRVLVYYEYYNRARSDQIQQLNRELAQLSQLARTIHEEQQQLAELEQSEQARLEELRGLRAVRAKIMVHLDTRIRDERQELTDLHEDRERLRQLLENLRSARAPAPGQMPNFEHLRGKLEWPVSGRLLNHFGGSRRNGAMSWQGVQLETESGEAVRAVSAGQVIFADWFRTLGLLIILDHGGGYMSLYGHNRELLKPDGAWVEDGEVIALAGKSGGQTRPVVYFEIRRDGKPVDPALWCSRRQ